MCLSTYASELGFKCNPALYFFRIVLLDSHISSFTLELREQHCW